MACAGHQVRNGIETGAVRHGRAIDDGVVAGHRIDIHKVGQPHGHQIALRDHHAFRSPGGAAGVKQPRQGVLVALGQGLRAEVGHGCEQGIGFGALDIDLALQPGQRCRRHVAGNKTPARAGILNDPLGFERVQLGVDRHHRQTSPPGAEQDLQIARMVAHEEQDPIPRNQTRFNQAPRQTRTARRPPGVAGVRRCAVVDGCAIGML